MKTFLLLNTILFTIGVAKMLDTLLQTVQPNFWQLLIQIPLAGVVLLTIIVFLNYLNKRDDSWQKYFDDQNIKWRDFIDIERKNGVEAYNRIDNRVFCVEKKIENVITEVEDVSDKVNDIQRVSDETNHVVVAIQKQLNKKE